MSTHNAAGWVTDPDALQLIIELNAIQPGDEIIIQNPVDSLLPDGFAGRTAVVVAPFRLHARSEHCVIDIAVDMGGRVSTNWHVWSSKSIAAWRRP